MNIVKSIVGAVILAVNIPRIIGTIQPLSMEGQRSMEWGG